MPELTDALLGPATGLARPADTGPLAIGSAFADRYAIEALLGRGGMGWVYRAHDRLVDADVALKVLTVLVPSEQELERVRREVRLGRRIASPHVARTHDLGTHAGLLFLTMELVVGRSLAEVLGAEGHVAPDRAARIAAGIARGLAAAHGAGVVHRDLKPENVLLELTGRVVVTDFGVARALESASRTGTAGIAGTPLYMSPEQVSGAALDARSDLYSLGVVLYQMLTGVLPFEADTPTSAALKRLSEAPIDPRRLGPVPDVLADLVLRCLARPVSARPASALAVAEELDRLADSLAVERGREERAPTIASVAPARPTPVSAATPTALRQARSLVVLPFAFRGASDDAYLADALADELVDQLSRTHGLRVLARSAGERFRSDRDPRSVGNALGVSLLVDGSVQALGRRLRVAVRLIDAGSEEQLLAEHFEVTLEDMLAATEQVARRIAEALRVGLTGVGVLGPVPAEAVDLYVRARTRVRNPALPDLESTIDMLDRALALAPDLSAAAALHALACLFAWIMPGRTRRDASASARASVARAIERAAEHPETHHAAALLAQQDGDPAAIAAALRRAIAIAPTYPDAHFLLGQLQIECGRERQGLAHVGLAVELEPGLPLGRYELARFHGLYGERSLFETNLAQIAHDPQFGLLVARLRVLVGAWRADEALLREGVSMGARLSHPAARLYVTYGRVMLGEIDAAEAYRQRDPLLDAGSPRFQAVNRQMPAECLARFGYDEAALAEIRTAIAGSFWDVQWLDHCPFLAGLRERGALAELRARVATRCEPVWGA